MSTPTNAPAMPADRVRLSAVERRLTLIERRVAFFEGRLDRAAAARAPAGPEPGDPIADFEARTGALEARLDDRGDAE